MKRILKYVILGLLEQGEKSGYDIKNCFNEEIGEFWSAKHSQIYPELRKLTEEGLITYRNTIIGEKLEKKIYSITDKGRKDLNNWLEKTTELPNAEKDEFILKLFFLKKSDKDILVNMFKSQIHLREEKLLFLKNRRDVLTQDPDFKEEQYGHYLILKRAINREKNYISWLKDELDNL